MLYDARSSRLVTAAACPALWEHRAVVSSRGHSGPLCSALYNSAFHVVGDRGAGRDCLVHELLGLERQ